MTKKTPSVAEKARRERQQSIAVWQKAYDLHPCSWHLQALLEAKGFKE